MLKVVCNSWSALEAPTIFPGYQACCLPQRQCGDLSLRNDGKELLGKLAARLDGAVIARILLLEPLGAHQYHAAAPDLAAEDLLRIGHHQPLAQRPDLP